MGCNKVFKRNSRALACIIWLNFFAGHNQLRSINADSTNMECYWFQYAPSRSVGKHNLVWCIDLERHQLFLEADELDCIHLLVSKQNVKLLSSEIYCYLVLIPFSIFFSCM